MFHFTTYIMHVDSMQAVLYVETFSDRVLLSVNEILR